MAFFEIFADFFLPFLITYHQPKNHHTRRVKIPAPDQKKELRHNPS